MITLLTGKPGTGKTAYAVKMLLEDQSIADRPIYTNITGLSLPHFPIDADWMRTWHKNVPPNAFVLFDECQDVFPPRHSSREPPEFVSELTKHRKDYSIDIFLITQAPALIDHGVRALVGRYLHIRETGLTRMIHEASEVVDFSEKSVRETQSSFPYSIPKQSFDLYTSSQVHTKKPKRRLPTAFWLFGLAGAIAVGLGVYVYKNRIASQISTEKMVEAQSGDLSPPAHQPFAPLQAVPKRIVEAMTPTDDHNPLSAPLYAAVVPPVVAPEIVGCIASRKSCTCYSQQSTPVWLPEEQCRQRAAGLYFDPYRQPVSESQTRPTPTLAQPEPPGLGRGFEGGTRQDVPRSPEGDAPPPGAGVS